LVPERQRDDTLLRVAFESSPAGMVMVDRDGAILVVNQEIERLFGYARKELVGQSIELLVPEDTRAAHSAHRAEFLLHPQRRAMGTGTDLLGPHRDGSKVPIEITLNPVETDTGLCALACVTDLTSRKRADEELRRSNAELQQFAYVASHDLQEPLRTVTSFLQLLERRYGDRLDADASEFIAIAVDGAARMQRLIEDLLSYSRVDTRGVALVPINAGVAVDASLQDLRAAIAESGARVERSELPRVLADPAQLQRVFTNLIGNALKFHGPEPPLVRIAAARDGAFWRFAVTDNGIGIEPKDYGRMFVIFQRLHSREEFPGTGIGLAICKKIVERHGGRIWLESVPGKGSTFLFTLLAGAES
jgi:PAS domain S-box-containing protein